MTAINDLGFRAVITPHGGRGFRVTAGGGTAIMVTNAGLLHEFLPASEVLRAAEAVLRVFKRFGDYEHKQRNRMKFMIKQLGWTRWREEYERELTACRLQGGSRCSTSIRRSLKKSRQTVRTRRPRPRYIAARVRAQTVSGPGITPNVVPVFDSSEPEYVRWRVTNVRGPEAVRLRDCDRRRCRLAI